MKCFNAALFATLTCLMTAGCSGHKIATLKEAICCDGGYEYRSRDRIAAEKAAADMTARFAALERERQRLAGDLAAAKQETDASAARSKSLEQQLTDRERELTSLRSSAGDAARLASQRAAVQGELDQSRARTGDLEHQLADLRAVASEKDRLAADLTSAQAQVAALQAGAGDKETLAANYADALAALHAGAVDKEKLAAERNHAKKRIAELEPQLAALSGSTADKDKLAAALIAAQQRISELEKQVSDREGELAGLRGDLSAEMAKLKDAERGLIRALRPQIEKGNIMVDLNNERLLINLASSYLYGSGEDQLKSAGADALKQVGAILKEFPEYKVTVDGHTDNRPIRSELKKRFPTNKELSEARAANAALALGEGGLNAVTTHGYAEMEPVMPNTTAAGRAKNRRVEVRVTK